MQIKNGPTLLGAPFDAHSSYLRGASLGPAAIRDALGSSATNMWTEGGIDLTSKLGDAGNAPSQEALTASVTSLIESGARPIILGGDHSVTYQILRAIRPHHRKLTLLQIDAHPDLYDQFDGDRLSHACQFARIMEEHLVDRLVQVGIRTMNHVQGLQRDRFDVEVVDMKAFASGTRPVIDGPLYVSIDLDGIDPAFAPGVAHREPGGLSSREVITLIQSIGGSVIGADVVELNPPRDADGITAPLAAKLVKELAGRMLA
jgi:arginase